MALIAQLQSLTITCVLLLTFPLCILAGVTTFLAAALLTFRVFLVYLELALAVVPYHLTGTSYTSANPTPTTNNADPRNVSYRLPEQYHSPDYVSTVPSPAARRRRRSSASLQMSRPDGVLAASDVPSSAVTSATITPVASQLHLIPGPANNASVCPPNLRNLASKSTTDLGRTSYAFPSLSIASHRLAAAVGTDVTLSRDYEGIGGWRLNGDDDTEDEALWTSINSRLELPAEHGLRHRRSRTAGSGKGGSFPGSLSGSIDLSTGQRRSSVSFAEQEAQHERLGDDLSITALSRSRSPEAERGIVMRVRSKAEKDREIEKERQRERESNIGRARVKTPGERRPGHGRGNGESFSPYGGSVSVRMGAAAGTEKLTRQRTMGTMHSTGSRSSGSSRGSVGPTMSSEKLVYSHNCAGGG